jgi:hypothetical protein
MKMTFENMSGRRGPGGSGTSPTAYGAHDTHRAEPIQSGFLPDYPALGRGIFFQRVIDVVTLVFAIVFVCALASSLPLAVFLMFFVSFD